MEKKNSIPSSFFKWDSTAKLGLGVIVAAVLCIVLIAVGAIKSSGKSSKPEGFIPEGTENVGLSESKLDEIKGLLSPLLRGKVSPFDGADSISSGETVSAILAYLSLENSYTAGEDGAILIPAAEVDSIFVSLFGVAPPRGDISETAVYDSENGLYSFYGCEYHTEYVIEILSARTLDDVVYIHTQVSVPFNYTPSETPSLPPSQSEMSSEAESERENSEDDTAVSSELSSDVSSEEAASDTVTSESESSEVSSKETQELEILRDVVFTLKQTNGSYTLIQMREAEAVK